MRAFWNPGVSYDIGNWGNTWTCGSWGKSIICGIEMSVSPVLPPLSHRSILHGRTVQDIVFLWIPCNCSLCISLHRTYFNFPFHIKCFVSFVIYGLIFNFVNTIGYIEKNTCEWYEAHVLGYKSPVIMPKHNRWRPRYFTERHLHKRKTYNHSTRSFSLIHNNISGETDRPSKSFEKEEKFHNNLWQQTYDVQMKAMTL